MERKNKAFHETQDALVAARIAEMDPEGRFIAQLLARVKDLEQAEQQRRLDDEVRTERRLAENEIRVQEMMKLGEANAKLEARVQALKYELGAKLSAALGPIQRQAATLLSEAAAKEEQQR